jgi:hypothetical protein
MTSMTSTSERALAMNRRKEEIDAGKVEALVAVLKDALPELVTTAFTEFKAELPRILPGLSDAEWEEIARGEVRRRAAMKFVVGDKVQKVGGDYAFVGVVVSAFGKHSGQVRYVVEDDRGILHIFSEKNLASQDEQSHAHPS